MAAGRASHVTDLGDGTILRIGGRPAEEARMMELARSHGFPAPAVHEVRADGLVMELIVGPSMGARLRRRPWLMRKSIIELADLHARLHRIPFEEGRLVHFDLHPDNVMLGPEGPVLIDWTNAHGGNPDADLAMTWLILETSAGPLGRLAAGIFRGAVGGDALRRGSAEATAFRLADPHVTDAERERVRRSRP